jgi:hypothetical protein
MIVWPDPRTEQQSQAVRERLLVETDPKKLNALVEQMTRIVEDNRLVRTFAQSGTRLLGISEGVILSACRSEPSQLSAAQRVSIPFLPEAHSVRLLAPAIYRGLAQPQPVRRAESSAPYLGLP